MYPLFPYRVFILSLQKWGGVNIKYNFPLPQVFPQPPFPLCVTLREPTVSAPRWDTLSTHIDKYRPLVMPLRFVRRLRNRMAQSLVLSVKFGVRLLAALRLVFRL